MERRTMRVSSWRELDWDGERYVPEIDRPLFWSLHIRLRMSLYRSLR